IRSWNKLRRHRYPRPPPLIIRHPPHRPPLIQPIATRLPNTEIPTSNAPPIATGVTLHEHATTNTSTPGPQGTDPVLPVESPTIVPPGTEPIIENLTTAEIPVTSSAATLTSPMTGLSQEMITEPQVIDLTTTKMTTLENDESSISTNTASQASEQPTTGLTPGPSTTFESHENDDVTTGPLSTATATAISASHSVTMIGDPVTQTANEQVATEELAEVPTTLLLTSTGPTIQTAETQDLQITEVQTTGPTSSQPLVTEPPITAGESIVESTPQIPT
ncbi:unnamed protein product, partial [Ixodes pacificus]